ncbi:porin [Sphingobacterium suaedae]|uniref:Porin n=1 Tax=Sphingobacterium suaedae TaxID=1686402 RepID=A0ABW5KHZ4_9SPHI
MNRIVIAATSLCFLSIFSLEIKAQEKLIDLKKWNTADSVETEEPSRADLFHLDVLLRAGFNVESMSEGERTNKINLDDARILLSGNYTDDLSYKVRFRLNRSFNPTSQDNASRALDMAFIKYKFGRGKKWSITAGKQSALVGSYEFENNPIYEFMFTDYVDRILNLFVVGGTLSYDITPNHSLNVQIYNTVNDSFADLHAKNGYTTGNLKPAKTPLGVYATWIGSFWDKKVHTKWSYNISQFASDETNHSISLANKLKTAKNMLYVDLQYSYLAVDHAMIASGTLNDFYARTGSDRVLAHNVNYKSAIVRYDQFITDKWEIALKGAYETAGVEKDASLDEDFRRNWTYFAALQHKPFTKQDLRFYLGYVGNTVSYDGNLDMENQQFNRLALGAYFTIPAL